MTLAVGFCVSAVTTSLQPASVDRLALPSTGVRLATLLAVIGGCGLYCVSFWSHGRRSLPMKTWRLALRTSRGAELSGAQALARYVAWWIGPVGALAAAVALRPFGQARWAFALLVANYAWALVDRNRDFLHDRLAGTRIFRASRRA